MFSWADFEREAPAVAAKAGELIERHRYMLAGTIRRDGTPRISPVETHFVQGHLVLAIEVGTHKARDLLRDARIVLNAPIADPDDPGAEVKVRGRAVAIEHGDLWEAGAEVIEQASGWRPPPDWHLFAIDVDDVAHIAWSSGRMAMDHWRRRRGVVHAEREIALGGEAGQRGARGSVGPNF